MKNLKILLGEFLKKKKQRLIQNKKKGRKLVVYVTNHIPIELFEAAGVDYLSWDHYITFYGAPTEYIEKNVPYIYFPNDWCIYSLSNFVLEVREPKPAVDLVAITYACDPVTKMWEYLEKNYDIFYFNLPRSINNDAIDYWCEITALLKKKLEEMTGREMTEGELREVIEKEKQIREKLTELRKGVFFMKDPSVKPSELLSLLYARSCFNQSEYLEILGKAEKIMGPIPKNNQDNRNAFYAMGPLFTEPVPKVLWENTVNGVDMLEKLENMGYKTMEENWLKYIIDDPYDLASGKSMVRLVGERSYLYPKHPALAPNVGIVENHQDMCRQFGLKGAIFFNYKGCRVYLVESRLIQYIFESEGKPYKHIQLSGKDFDLPEVTDTMESFILANS
ncbi:MAG: 2-hydroxyacyl-CoA dehydratase [Candidatus Omnitrophota bacterium]